MSGREKGVAQAQCPGCGADLALQEQPDGSIAAARCEDCYGDSVVEETAPEPEKANRQPRRERGTEKEES